MSGGRRPLAVRGTRWAQQAAQWLTAQGVAPDMISKASLGFAAAALGFFWLAGLLTGWAVVPAFLLAGLAIQGRLLCNLFDGMVAVEGGKGGPEGPFWNEVPDRPADVLILAGAGLSCGSLSLGLTCGIAALGTAYLRAMGASLGQQEDFGGPLAKQQRMAAVTALAIIAACEAVLFGTATMMWAGLWVVLAGTVLTCWLRGRRLLRNLT